MIFCTTAKNAKFFDSISKVPLEALEELQCDENIYLSKGYLQSIEENHPDIVFNYVVLTDEQQRPIAFAVLQMVKFYLDEVNDSVEDFLLGIKKVLRKVGIFPNKKPVRLLVSGNIFVSGEHGVFIKANQDKKKVFKQLAKVILHFTQNNTELANSIDAFMLKDFWDESLFITNELKRFNFHPFSVEPNMKFDIQSDWSSFDDYLAAMKTKFRVKAKKALSQSKDLVIKRVSKEEIDHYLPQMFSLYKRVANSATFNLSDFNLNSYKNLLERFGPNYIIATYWLDDQMVGFLSGIINQKTLDAHFVGIDYKYNRSYAIYQRMLYDYIKYGIEHQLESINFGRTASEIKSSVGAEPENLTIYLKHRKRFTNRLLKLFLYHVQPTPFHQKFPFKTANT